jgi:hypothetical protein
MKFSKETKDRLRLNPNVKEVYQSTIHYTNEFKTKALYEFEMGKHPKDIFQDAGFNLSEISTKPYYANKMLNQWKLQERKNIHLPQNKLLKFDSKREQYLMAKIACLEEENKLLKKLQGIED